jgi:hypothetical protein
MRATKIILSPYGGGRGVWAEHLRWAAPESVALFLGAFTCVYRSGWARAPCAASLSRYGHPFFLFQDFS